MPTTKPVTTIAEVFEGFLAEQKPKQSAKTHAKYRDIIGLFESYLESYWPGHSDEYDRVTKAGGTFCKTYGPTEILDGYGEFLGYFMPRKVMCGKETLRAAGTVTKKLAKWLAEKGYVEDVESAEDAQERAAEAAAELPAAQDVLDILDAFIDAQAIDPAQETLEDHFYVQRIEPGKLWLEPFTTRPGVIGPVPVPTEVTDLCQPMWDIGGVVTKARVGWRFVELWNVTP